MKIVLLNTQMEAGGAQKALLVLARGLKQRDHDVVVVSMYDKGDYISIFSQRYGLEIINLQMKSKGNILKKLGGALTGLGQLRHLMKAQQVDVVQTFSHYSNLIGPLLAWTVGVPVRVSSQRMSLRGAPHWLRFLDRLVANSWLVQMMTAVSEGTRHYCIEEEGIRPEKILTIYNGVDVSRYSADITEREKGEMLIEMGVPETAVLITHVARLHPQKGHQHLLQAIPKIITKVPDARFLLVGEGDLRPKLENEIERTGLTSHVHLLGMRQDVPKILAISDLFILPSLWEGLPNSVLEAMASGLPVVASSVDGNPEIVVDGETGLLIPPAQPDALAEAVIKILQNPSLARQMGQAGQKRVSQVFSIEQNISAYERLYEQLLASRKNTNAATNH